MQRAEKKASWQRRQNRCKGPEAGAAWHSKELQRDQHGQVHWAMRDERRPGKSQGQGMDAARGAVGDLRHQGDMILFLSSCV